MCGLPQALDYLRNLRFTEDEIAYLHALPVMRHVLPSFWDRLRTLRFTGEVWAMAEGTRFYANQPIVRITGPIIEAQLVETALLAIIGFQTAVASKAARVVAAAAGKPVAEFGSRHAHGTQAALYAARAAVLGGCVSTSNAEAGMRFGLPVSGTMAHSFIMAQPGGPDDEAQAFADFCAVFPGDATLLLDTYDTMQGLERMIERGLRPNAVRLDSGDMLDLSRHVRARLDAAGMHEVKIFATGDLNEYRIAELIAARAPIDSFGVGTELSTSKDHPALSAVYKLVHIEGPGILPGTEGRSKQSTDKSTQPGKKQVWRFFDEQGRRVRDVVADEKVDAQSIAGAQTLLRPQII
jgi:nicotinate phosphoribosyltransferase